MNATVIESLALVEQRFDFGLLSRIHDGSRLASHCAQYSEIVGRDNNVEIAVFEAEPTCQHGTNREFELRELVQKAPYAAIPTVATDKSDFGNFPVKAAGHQAYRCFSGAHLDSKAVLQMA